MPLTTRCLSSLFAKTLRFVWIISASLFFCGCFLIKGVDVEDANPPLNTGPDMSAPDMGAAMEMGAPVEDMLSLDQGHADMTADMADMPACSPATTARLCQIARRDAPLFCGEEIIEDPCTGEQKAVTCTCSANEQCADNTCSTCTPPDKDAVCAIAKRCDMITAKDSCDRDVSIDCSVCPDQFECLGGVCQQREIGPCESVGAECGLVQIDASTVYCGSCEENENCSGEKCVKDLPACPTMNMCGSATQVCVCGGLESCLLGTCGVRELDAGAHVEAESMFGDAVALHDDLMVVGASRADVNGKANAGAAFIFRRDQRVGEWRLVQRLDSPDPEANAHFGSAVAANSRFIAIGERGKDGAGNGESNHGRVIIYEMSDDGSSWSLLHSISPDESSMAATEARFGRPILFREGQLFISAPGSSVGGQVEVFEFEADAWVRKQTISSDTTMNADVGHFGSALDVRGDLMLVGAPSMGTTSPGSAYLYKRAAGMWSLEQELIPAMTSPALVDGDNFGADVVLLGGSVTPHIPVVNARGRTNMAGDTGELFFFPRFPMGWENRQVVTETAGKGIKALVGRGEFLLASNESDNSGAGAVHLFKVSTSQGIVTVTPRPDGPYTASISEPGIAFGHAIALWGSTAVSSAISRDIDTISDAGAVYFFDLD